MASVLHALLVLLALTALAFATDAATATAAAATAAASFTIRSKVKSEYGWVVVADTPGSDAGAIPMRYLLLDR